MADLFDKIFQNFKTYYNNGYNLLKKLRDIYYGRPQDITLQWQDPDSGAIQNLTVPSFAKMRDRFINDVNSAMSKHVYVDAENGSDETGDGSSSVPFKTLKKAIDSIPPGGIAIIYLAKGRTYVIDSHIRLVNKKISIFSATSINADYPDLQNSQNAPVIEFRDGGHISLIGSTISFGTYFRGVYIKDAYSKRASLVHKDSLTTGGGQFILPAIFDIAHSRMVLSNNAYISSDVVRIRKTAINHSGQAKFIKIIETLNLQLNEPILRNPDDSNAMWNWSNVIENIVKDSNGVPRNIISNIVL